MNLFETLTRPIAFLDIDATCLDVAKARIVSLAITRLSSSMGRHHFSWLFNPGEVMTDDVIAIHGITNEQVAAADKFGDQALAVHEALSGYDLGGYNLLNFDIPVLWEDMYRAGIEWKLDGVQVVDVGNLFKKKEPRGLEAAVQFYLDRKHDSAHDASGDVAATIEVFEAQLKRYNDLPSTLAEIAAYTRMDDRVDFAGKIVRDKNGDPVYNIGKSKGVKVKDDPGFGFWMLSKDFSENTKIHLRKILQPSEDGIL